MGQSGFPAPLLRLTALLGETLGGPAAPSAEIGTELVALASRHQVGPLLYAAAAGGRHIVAPDVWTVLKQSYRDSVARRGAALLVLERVGRQFETYDIGWMAIKGTTQAALLYPDPAWRDSADIDLLVRPDQFGRALDALVALGFVASYPPVPARGLLRQAILGAVRDVMLVARADPRDSIELHRRVFFAGGRHADFLTLPATPGVVPTPALGPDLAFYLIAHGALSFWVRLKWLADLVPLLAKLSGGERLAILELARRTRTESSVAASLLLLRALFPFAALEELGPWLEQKKSRPSVQRRLRRYGELLGRDDDRQHSPLNDALVMLEASLMLFEAPLTRARVLLSAPLSSVLRRTAGLIYRADRALTLP
jgi:hypothetical protein